MQSKKRTVIGALFFTILRGRTLCLQGHFLGYE